MATAQPAVSEMLVIVKARELQRAMMAAMANESDRAARHFLAAAHLEMVLADDYAQAGQSDMAFRSRLSAASSLWRGGQEEQARGLFESLLHDYPAKKRLIQDALASLKQD